MSDRELLDKPALVNIHTMLSEAGRGFYIPLYQRHYSWTDEKIGRFFEDFIDGIKAVTKKGAQEEYVGIDNETFMGTIVCFDDQPPYTSVHPFVENDVPAGVYSLIDGQQRMTVSLVMILFLHDFMRLNTLKVEDTAEKSEGLLQELQQDMVRKLESLLSIPASGEMEYYTKMIRGLEDVWSKQRSKCKYSSPLASLLSRYIDHISSEETKHSKFTFTRSETTSAHHKKFNTACLKPIGKFLKELIAIKENPKAEFNSFKLPFDRLPDIKEVFCKKGGVILTKFFRITHPCDFFGNLQERCSKLSETATAAKLTAENAKKAATKAGVADKDNDTNVAKEDKAKKDVKTANAAAREADKNAKAAKKKLDLSLAVGRALMLSAYLLQSVKYILLVTRSDDYAFSIFDSLNTTGDPLTAYETFKADVVKRYGKIEEYNNSQSCAMIKEIDNYLVEDKLEDKKTKELLVNFALAENGEKISKQLNRQRRYMREQYKEQKDRESSEHFIFNLRSVARIHECFQSDNNNKLNFISDIKKDEYNGGHVRIANQALFCLCFLVAAKHTITVPLISRFYSKFVNASVSDKKECHLEMCGAICSIASFFAIWRISRDDTANIDAHHRSIMKTIDGRSELGFNRKGKLPILAELQNEFCRLLSKDKTWPLIEDDPNNEDSAEKLSFEKWEMHSLSMPIYKEASKVAKFILLLDAYWESKPGPHQKLIFSDTLWNDPAHETIDHIKPQSTEGLDPAEQKSLDSIGNLTLLPMRANSFIGNKQWEEGKKEFYAAFIKYKKDGNNHKAELKILELSDRKLEELEKHWITVCKSSFLPAIKDISSYVKHTDASENSGKRTETFDFASIEERGMAVLASAWGPLIEWLGSDTHQDRK